MDLPDDNNNNSSALGTKPIKSFYKTDDLVPTNNKYEASRIAVICDLSRDVIYQDYRGKHMLHSPSLGTLYDRLVPNYQSLDTLESVANNVTNILQQILDECPHDTNDVMKDDIIQKQATTFLKLLSDMIADPTLINRSMLMPTLSAILACIKSSWKPTHISAVRFNFSLCP